MAAIFKLSDAVAIGLHGAMFLAADANRTATAGRIAKTFRISEAHLVKVLQTLVRSGILSATRGPGGGYRLARPAKSIRLIEPVEALMGPLDAQTCLLHHPMCRGRRCLLAPAVADINSQMLAYLRKNTLHDLAAAFRADDPPDAAQPARLNRTKRPKTAARTRRPSRPPSTKE